MKSFTANFLKNISDKLKNLTNIISLSIFKTFNIIYGNITSIFRFINRSSYFVAFWTRFSKIFRKIHKVIYFTIYLLYHEVYITAVKPMLARGFGVVVNCVNRYIATYRFLRIIHNCLKAIYISFTKSVRRFCLFF
jgi:hypothetical protein